MSKKAIIIGVIIIVALGGAYYLATNQSTAPTTYTAPATQTTSSAQGRVVVGISDAATAISGVSSIMVTVDKVEVQDATQAWVTVSNASKQYDLLKLKQSGAVALLADVNLPVGTYNQIRLDISKVTVTVNGKTQDAKLPSGTLKIVGRVVIEDGKTATVVMDFKADKSLHITGNGKFILAPVVNLETKSDATVSTQSDNTLKINGGKVEDNKNVGMDEQGNTKDNFQLDANAKLEIDAEDVIHISGQGGINLNAGGGENNGGGENSGSQTGASVTLNLSAQNNSGIGGTATLTDLNGKTRVTLNLSAVPTGVLGLLGISLGAEHPAHIHAGSCANLGAVKYPLNSTVNGESVTTVNVSLATLRAELPLAVNVHKSAAEIGTYVACADLNL